MLGQGGSETHLFGALGESPLNPNTEFFKRWSEKDSRGDFCMAATVPYFPSKSSRLLRFLFLRFHSILKEREFCPK